ncbi:MAG: hypothetical protein KatS3mg090_0615 [Patescibacteria group bacterium]|nr:MAG: hypothetical protein KatS3mg090_0615 [Patescibacteria group bacterium]
MEYNNTTSAQVNNNPSSKTGFAGHIVEEVRVFSGKKIVRIVIGIIAVLIALGVVFFVYTGGFTQAGDQKPTDVVIANITEGSAQITWKTAVAVQAVVEYGTTPTALNFFAPETEKTTDHKVDLTLLSPETTYYFQIRVGDTIYDNAGVPWSFTTRSKTQNNNSQAVPTPTSANSNQNTNQSENTQSSPTATPTPYQSFKLNSNGNKVNECNYTNCDDIKANLGKGCSLKQYLDCRNKEVTPTNTPASEPTPTETPTPSPTPTSAEPTATPSPSLTPTPTS